MANGLEVRTPFLDYRVVDFAFSLPESFKINGKIKKRIVQDAFRDILPIELYNRPKHGFEIPLLDWLRTDLKDMVDELLNENSEINVNKRIKVIGGVANTGDYALMYDEYIAPTINSSSLYWAKTKSNIYLEDCRVATTTNISLVVPPSSIDGIVLADNDRILVKNQTIKSENGIYVVSDSKTNVWIRSNDLKQSVDLVPQLSLTVTEGSINQNLMYRILLPVPRTITTTQLTNYILGTDNIDWIEVDPNGIFASSPESWTTLSFGSGSAVNLGNFKLNTYLKWFEKTEFKVTA
jgi:hypothetical protein